MILAVYRDKPIRDMMFLKNKLELQSCQCAERLLYVKYDQIKKCKKKEGSFLLWKAEIIKQKDLGRMTLAQFKHCVCKMPHATTDCMLISGTQKKNIKMVNRNQLYSMEQC